MALTVEVPQKKTPNPFWYLQRDDALKDVTSEASNAKLGINRIVIFPPTEAQKRAGILCKVLVDTLCGTFQNISIEEAKYGEGALRVNLPSKQIVDRTSGDKKYVNDYVLKSPCKAQILSYVSTLIKTEE